MYCAVISNDTLKSYKKPPSVTDLFSGMSVSPHSSSAVSTSTSSSSRAHNAKASGVGTASDYPQRHSLLLNSRRALGLSNVEEEVSVRPSFGSALHQLPDQEFAYRGMSSFLRCVQVTMRTSVTVEWLLTAFPLHFSFFFALFFSSRVRKCVCVRSVFSCTAAILVSLFALQSNGTIL